MEMIELFVFLMQKEKTTCKEIADRFEVCERTAHRKVERLSFIKSVYYLAHWAIRGVFKYK